MRSCLCAVEYEIVVLKDGHTLFLLCRVKVLKVCDMYRFCVNISPLKTKRRLLYLKTEFLPRSKHFSSRL